MSTRACKNCGTEFESKHKRHLCCGSPECLLQLSRERTRRWAIDHPQGGREASRRYREIHGDAAWPAKRALGLEIQEMKSTTPCADCDTIYPAVCMDFDHLPQFAKSNNVGTMVAHGHSRVSVMAEIAKCELVCANCHRIRTNERSLAA